jgi:hypothetical protein
MNDLPKVPVEDLSVEDLTKRVYELFSKLEKVLRKLELPDGPKLTHQHIGLIGATREFAFSSKKEATDTKHALERAANALKMASIELKALPDTVNRRLALFSKISDVDTISDGSDEFIFERPHLDLILEIESELTAELRRTEDERNLVWNGPGKTFDAEARLIAWKVAEIYMQLKPGQIPTISKSNNDEPTSPYTRAVDSVFRLLLIEISYRSPCEYVVKKLKKGELVPNYPAKIAIINDSDT